LDIQRILGPVFIFIFLVDIISAWHFVKDRIIPYSKYAHIKYKNTDTTEHRVE
jgi:hypothetical protein